MKLDYKKTFLLGFGFLAIELIWSLFNSFVPIFLKAYISSNALIGFLMTLDNYAGFFLQPTFGTLSDRTNTRFGKRMPYLLIGMPIAAVSVALIPLHWDLTSLIVIIIAMNVVMATFRSPTVALMPDITPEPQRSKANSIINLMGGLGAIIAFFVGSKLYSLNHGYPFYMAAVVMLISLVVLNLNIREKRDSINYNAVPEPKVSVKESDSAPHREPVGNIFLLLFAIFLWFMAFDAINAFFTLYGKEYLHVNEAAAAIRLTFFSLAMLVFAIPAGILATKIGRKRTILIGLGLICLTFGGLEISHNINTIGYLFIICGAAWAMININSYPLLLSMSTGERAGRFTGYYYAFSCLAGIVSPTLCGLLIDRLGYAILFKYAVCGLVLAFFVMLFVKDAKAGQGLHRRGGVTPGEAGGSV
ncbi:MAG: SLC45 family MFS transporter [Clostridia bacterium]|nr:SLC45 family MFS transporter [Clostridia bacterium]